LQVLQQAAGDKENLVGGSRQPATNVKVGVKSGEKCEINNAINEKLTEQILMKGNLKKRKVADKIVQTDAVDDEPKITITDLTSEEPPSENYWQLLAEKRRIALEECLEENRTFHERIQLLEEGKEVTEQMLAESRSLVEVLEEIIGENEEGHNDSERK
jgi:geminin